MEERKIYGLKVIYTSKVMIIKDSYKIKNPDKMKDFLKIALNKTEEYYTDRSYKSLINEWISHNHLYSLHLFRKHTKDCDFENKQNFLLTISYFILGLSFRKIKNKIKQKKKKKAIKKQEKAYLKYIENHKENIYKAFDEMKECSIVYQLGGDDLLNALFRRVVEHDNSKYSLQEFDAYRKNFFPISQQEKEENKKDFEKAWEHHWRHNPHHWQYRQNKESFNRNNEEEVLDVLENVLDWMAMGYQFNDRPYQYYENNKENIKLCNEEKAFLEYIIYEGIDAEYIKEEKENGTRE